MANTLLIAAGSLFLGLLPTQHANGTTIIDYNFEDGQTTGWITSNTNHSYISVVADPLDATNKVLKVDDSWASMGALWTTLGSGHTNGIYEVKVSILVADSGGAAGSPSYALDRRISLASKDNSVTYTRLRTNAGTVLTSGYNGNGSGGGSFVNGPTVNLNKWYEITQILDLSTDKWTWSIRDIATDTLLYSSSELGSFFYTSLSNGLTTLSFPQISSGGVFYLDDVKVSVVPEPSSICLMMLAGLVLFAARHRKKYFRC